MKKYGEVHKEKLPYNKPILHFLIEISAISFYRHQIFQIRIIAQITVDPVWKSYLFLQRSTRFKNTLY